MGRNKNRTWLIIAALALLVSLAWIGVAAARTFRKPTLPSDVTAVLSPLDPTLDTAVFTKLAKRNGGK